MKIVIIKKDVVIIRVIRIMSNGTAVVTPLNIESMSRVWL